MLNANSSCVPCLLRALHRALSIEYIAHINDNMYLLFKLRVSIASCVLCYHHNSPNEKKNKRPILSDFADRWRQLQIQQFPSKLSFIFHSFMFQGTFRQEPPRHSPKAFNFKYIKIILDHRHHSIFTLDTWSRLLFRTYRTFVSARTFPWLFIFKQEAYSTPLWYSHVVLIDIEPTKEVQKKISIRVLPMLGHLRFPPPKKNSPPNKRIIESLSLRLNSSAECRHTA